MYNSQVTIERINIAIAHSTKTKTELNAYCGIDKGTINQSGKSKYGLGAKILSDIADYLNCSVDYLLGRTDVITVADGEKLTADETELLAYFRQLTGKEQQRLIGRAETLAEQENEAS